MCVCGWVRKSTDGWLSESGKLFMRRFLSVFTASVCEQEIQGGSKKRAGIISINLWLKSPLSVQPALPLYRLLTNPAAFQWTEWIIMGFQCGGKQGLDNLSRVPQSTRVRHNSILHNIHTHTHTHTQPPVYKHTFMGSPSSCRHTNTHAKCGREWCNQQQRTERRVERALSHFWFSCPWDCLSFSRSLWGRCYAFWQDYKNK